MKYKFLIILLILLLPLTVDAAQTPTRYGFDMLTGSTFNNNTAFVNSTNFWVTNIGVLSGVNTTQFNNVAQLLTIDTSYLRTFGNGQWLRLDGTTPLTGDWNYGPFNINGSGNVTAEFFKGDGSLLTGISGLGVNDTLALANALGNGITDGGIITIGTDPAKFDITASKGWFVNNSNPVPNLEYVECPAFDEVTITNIATAQRTDVAIKRDCSLVQRTTPFSNSDRRSEVVLGRIVHANNINITVVVNLQHYIPGIYDQWLDFTHAIGNLNTDGNVYSPASTDLSLNRTSGKIFRIGANYINNKDNPNEVAQGSETNISFFYRYQDGSGGITQSPSAVTQVDVDMYDDGSGTLASVPNNKFAITRVYLFSDNATVLQYGQALYSKLSEATAAITTEVFVEDPNLQMDAVLRGWIIARGNTVDLSNTAKVKIVTAGKFGTLGGGAGTSAAQEVTLQNAYDNSLEPEITLDSTNNGLTIRDALIALGVNLLEIQNYHGNITYFNVSALGVSLTGGLNINHTLQSQEHENSTVSLFPYRRGNQSFTTPTYTTGVGIEFFKNATFYNGTHNSGVNYNPQIAIWGATSSGARYGTIGIDDYNRLVFGGTTSSTVFSNTLNVDTLITIGGTLRGFMNGNLGSGGKNYVTFGGSNDAADRPTWILTEYAQRELNFAPTSTLPQLWLHDGSSTPTNNMKLYHNGTNGYISSAEGDIIISAEGGDVILNATNITADFFKGDGSLLTGISGGIWQNISNVATYNGNVNILNNLTVHNLINGLNISANATHLNLALLGSTNLVNETTLVMEGGDVSLSPTNPSHFNILGEENGNIDGSNGGFEWSAGNGMEARTLDIAPCDGVIYKVAFYCEVSSTTTTEVNITLNQVDQDCSTLSPGSNDGISGYASCNLAFEENDGISWRTTLFGTGTSENQCIVQAQARCNG